MVRTLIKLAHTLIILSAIITAPALPQASAISAVSPVSAKKTFTQVMMIGRGEAVASDIDDADDWDLDLIMSVVSRIREQTDAPVLKAKTCPIARDFLASIMEYPGRYFDLPPPTDLLA